ncbi:hypothetical protein NOI24_16320 [Neorhizobium galegae]|uniref:hypothetical protein n=1 Tax=Neorhizobium galegae TaxID=399 RepID=UPI00210708F5|nr:hypothetical protein [Neorhizobium galegae]MCQ1772876.1 hypothetical protein [Neorhizobium galegae]MCQ1799177.1 hypothetical protein [Neorhizobium galegae]
MNIVKIANSSLEILFDFNDAYMADLNAFNATECITHEEYEWRKLPIAGGDYQVRKQCLCCGHVIAQARKQSEEDIFLHWTDPGAQGRYQAKRMIERDAIMQKHARLQAKRGVIASYHLNKKLRDRLFVYDGTKQGKRRLDAALGVGFG